MMNKYKLDIPVKHLFLVLLVMFLTSCNTAPKFDTSSVNLSITPELVLEDLEKHRNETVLWGGVVLSSRNLDKSTQIEILAYPLDSNNKPNTEKAAFRRFIGINNGYLETLDFAPGRLVTVVGTITGEKFGKIGEMEYRYPFITLSKVHLWPRHSDRNSPSDIQFGFGISIHN